MAAMRATRPPVLGTGIRLRRWALAAAAALVLAAVFAAYLDPHLAVDLANRVWAACGL
jgi:hypothetical protein